MFQLANFYFIQHKERIGSYTCPLAITPPSWSRFLSGWHSATQKDQPFILRVRKYELRGAEPFILCRTLVPIMTAALFLFFFHALSGKSFFRFPSSTSSNFSVCSSLSFPGSSRNIFFCKYHHLPSQKPSSVLYFAGISKVPCTF